LRRQEEVGVSLKQGKRFGAPIKKDKIILWHTQKKGKIPADRNK